MAAAKAFHVRELLEAILLELPTKDMFYVKAVSKSWKEAIGSSIRLQRAMHLVPDGEVLQPLRNYPFERLTGEDYVRDLPVMEPRPLATQPRFLCLDGCVLGEDYPDWGHFDNIRRKDDLTDDPPELSWHNIRLVCDTGSRILLPRICRSLYLCQPPVAAALLSVCRNNCGDVVEAVIYDRGGITLGLVADVYAEVRKGVDKRRDGRYYSDAWWRDYGNRTPCLYVRFLLKGSDQSLTSLAKGWRDGERTSNEDEAV